MSTPATRVTPAEPADALAYLVKHAHQRLTAAADAALEPLGVDSKEFGVLRLLAGRNPLSQQELSARLGIDRTTMVARIDDFEARGLVTRRPDPADRRRNAVELTPAGERLVADADAAYLAAERAFLAPLGSAGADGLRAALRKLLGL